MTTSAYKYNAWPIGKVPKELQRPELEQIKELGFHWSDPRDVVDLFEYNVAKFAGSNYAVATDSCTHAIELCIYYLLHIGELEVGQKIIIPSHTYISIYILLKRLGFDVQCEDKNWSGIYQLEDTRIYDGAVRWRKNMYIGTVQPSSDEEKIFHLNALQCVSFQIKKRIPIGRGGIVLTNDYKAYEFLKAAAYDGRDLKTPYDSKEHMKMLGWHYYMTPEDCARGLILMNHIKEEGDTGDYTKYPDIREMIKNIK